VSGLSGDSGPPGSDGPVDRVSIGFRADLEELIIIGDAFSRPFDRLSGLLSNSTPTDSTRGRVQCRTPAYPLGWPSGPSMNTFVPGCSARETGNQFPSRDVYALHLG